MTLKKMDVEKYIKGQAELDDLIQVDETHIVISLPNNEFEEKYEILRDSCKTGDQVVSWVFQLTEKNWITREMLRRFIKVASANAGIEL